MTSVASMEGFVERMPESQKALGRLIEACRQLPDPHQGVVGNAILDLIVALSSEARRLG